MAAGTTVARAHYLQQQTLVRNVASALEVLWSRVDVRNISASWAGELDRAVQLLALGQYTAARAAIAYIGTVVEVQGADPAPLGSVDPRALAGKAADGRSLAGLLTTGAIRAQLLVDAGMTDDAAMRSGLARVLRAGVNEVVQAGISGATARIGVTPAVTGYTRVLTPPSCSRCVILAGRHYAHNAGFLRHPRCDCVHLPSTDGAAAEVVSPEAAFESMTRAEQDAVFTKAGAEAIRNGADMGRVVNARQSTYVPTGRRTARGTPTRRTVEDLLERAGSDRDKFVALLDSAGYLT